MGFKVYFGLFPIALRLHCFPLLDCEAFAKWLISQDWTTNYCQISKPSTDNIASALTSKVQQAIDNFFYLGTIKLHPSDKSWMTSLRNLITKRQWTLSSGNTFLWHYYRQLLQIGTNSTLICCQFLILAKKQFKEVHVEESKGKRRGP